MKAVIQRVRHASVQVEGNTVASIARGILVLLGVQKGDDEAAARRLAERIATYRIFEDEVGRMNRSVQDIGGAVLVVSQFTLCADCRKGRRPSFGPAAHPEEADALYRRFAEYLKSFGVPVECGVFGAMMDVCLVNQGPVTFILES